MTARVPSKLKKTIEWLLRRAEGALLPDAVLAEAGGHLDPVGARLALRAGRPDLPTVDRDVAASRQSRLPRRRGRLLAPLRLRLGSTDERARSPPRVRPPPPRLRRAHPARRRRALSPLPCPLRPLWRSQ